MSDEVRESHMIKAGDADAQLPELLDRVERGESVTIMRHGRPVARLVPVSQFDKDAARAAAARIRERRKRLKGAPIEELIQTTHEGHRS